jgi:hypothetical protein
MLTREDDVDDDDEVLESDRARPCCDRDECNGIGE